MTNVLERAPLTTALATWLEEAVGRPVGRLQSPVNRPFPYSVLYAVPGGSFSGPGLAHPDADAGVVYQVNSVALRDTQAEELADAVRSVILGRDGAGAFTTPPPALVGWTIIGRGPDGNPGGVEYSGTPPKRVFTAAERFVFYVTPA